MQSYDNWLAIRPNKSKDDLCPRGHEFSDSNTRIKLINNRYARVCKTCQYDTAKKDFVSYKVKNFVRGVENRKEIIEGLIDKINHLGVKCFYCEGDFECLDHYIPKKLNGPISIENINPSCNRCNQKRKSKF
jgi:5-methylcytosine-specific restriction endonuclease McrA